MAVAYGLEGATWHRAHWLDRGWVPVVWAGHVFTILATAYGLSRWPGEFFLRPFCLAQEKTIATWWIAVQFLLMGLLAFSVACQRAGTDRALTRAAAVLGAIGLILFADEMGSAHERVQLIASGLFGLEIGANTALAPFGLLGAALAGVAVTVLWRRRGTLGTAWLWLLVGFAALATVQGQEYLEHHVNWAAWAIGPRAALEEGTEAFGSFCLLFGVFRMRQRSRLEPATQPMILPDARLATHVLVGGAVLCVPVVLLRTAFTAEQLQIPDRGDFGVVLPTLLWFVAALIAALAACGARQHPRGWWLLAVALMVTSVDAHVHLHDYVLRDDAWAWRGDLDLLWLVPALGLIAAPLVHAKRRSLLLLCVATMVLAIASAVLFHAVLLYLVGHLAALGWLAWMVQAREDAAGAQELAGDTELLLDMGADAPPERVPEKAGV